jgi:hypothetical protein
MVELNINRTRIGSLTISAAAGGLNLHTFRGTCTSSMRVCQFHPANFKLRRAKSEGVWGVYAQSALAINVWRKL